MNEEFDFIAIGDIVTDAFIRINRASVYYDEDDKEEKICLTNGAKIPYESVTVIPAVGNSPNAAANATNLGLHAALVTNLGDDSFGKECIRTLEEREINTRFVKIHPEKVSNYNFVLWHHAERTILIKHEDYEYTLPDIGSPKWIYFSSVGENSMDYHRALLEYLKEHPDTKLAFQPGTLQIKLGYEKLKDIYMASELFFCNLEEAQIILKTDEVDGAKLAKMMFDLGPKISIVTDGPKGAYVFDGEKYWHMPTYPTNTPPFECTGAGDGFASTFTSALALGLTVPEALRWAPIQSMSIVQHIGAQAGLLTREKIEEFIAKAPDEYRPQELG